MKRLAAVLGFLVIFPAAHAQAQTVVATDVAEDATEANSQPKIGADSHGRIYLAFEKPAGGYSQIFVATSADSLRWDLQQVTRVGAHARYATLAVGPDDTVHLAWTQYDGGTGHVYYARRTNQGWSAPAKVSPGNAYAGIPALAVDARGIAHMVWYGIRAGAPAVTTRHGSLYEILYTSASSSGLRPAPNGAGWHAPDVISPGIPDSINPALVIDDAGRLHSAWYQFDLRNYQVRHTVADRVWARPETISSGRADSMAVTLAAGPGTVPVVWERRDAGGSHIYFAERTQRWSGQQQISPPAQRAFNPSVAVDARSRVYVAWDSSGQIYLRRRDGAWRGVERIGDPPGNARPIIAAAGRSVLLMWTQQHGDEAQLRVAVVTETGAPSPRARPPWGLIAAGLLVVTYYLLSAALIWRRTRKTV